MYQGLKSCIEKIGMSGLGLIRGWGLLELFGVGAKCDWMANSRMRLIQGFTVNKNILS